MWIQTERSETVLVTQKVNSLWVHRAHRVTEREQACAGVGPHCARAVQRNRWDDHASGAGVPVCEVGADG